MTNQFLLTCMLAGAVCAACGAADDHGDADGAGGGATTPFGGAGGASGASSSGGTSPSGATGGVSAAAGTHGGPTPATGGSSPGGTSGNGGSIATGGTAGESGTAGMAGTGGTAGLTGSGGTAGMAGTGGTAGMAGTGATAGLTGSGGSSGSDDPCAGGTVGPASDATDSKTRVSGYGGVQLVTSTKTKITSIETTLEVPPEPKASGTLFLWPGLEPLSGSANFNPIGTGVLQPVLTWGGTCAPNAPNDYAGWWISAQYVNTLGNATGFTGCKGGDGMRVAVGDKLHILMTLSGTTWSQSVTDDASGKKVTFDFDLKGQTQNWLIFSIEIPTATKPVADVVFTSSILTTADSDPAMCTPSQRGTNDYFSAPRTSPDGRSCCISKLILRAQGVAATGPNG